MLNNRPMPVVSDFLKTLKNEMCSALAPPDEIFLKNLNRR